LKIKKRPKKLSRPQSPTSLGREGQISRLRRKRPKSDLKNQKHNKISSKRIKTSSKNHAEICPKKRPAPPMNERRKKIAQKKSPPKIPPKIISKYLLKMSKTLIKSVVQSATKKYYCGQSPARKNAPNPPNNVGGEKTPQRATAR